MSGLDDLLGSFGLGGDPLKGAAERAQRERNRKAAAATDIRGRTIDGVLYVRAIDVATTLRTEGLDDSVTLRRLRKYLARD